MDGAAKMGQGGVDASKIKPGDKVLIELVVGEESDRPDRIVVRTEDMRGYWQVPLKSIVYHAPAPREAPDAPPPR